MNGVERSAVQQYEAALHALQLHTHTHSAHSHTTPHTATGEINILITLLAAKPW